MTEPRKPDPDKTCFVIVHDPVTQHRHVCGKPAVLLVADWHYCLEHQP